MTEGATGMHTTTTTASNTDVLGKRVLATLADTVILTVGIIIFASAVTIPAAATQSGTLIALASILSSIVPFIAFFGYYMIFESLRGATPGKMFFGLRVVGENGGNPDMKAAAIRNVLRILDGFAAYLVGFLVANSSPERQRIGDKVARTHVVGR